MIVVGIDTATPQVSVAIGTETAILGRIQIAGAARQESVTPALEQLLAWTGTDLDHVGGFTVGIGPGLFTGLRVGVETAKTLAQVTGAPLIGLASIDALAYAVRHTERTIAAVIDGRRKEVFTALYRPVPGGVVRLTEPAVQRPAGLAADLEAAPRGGVGGGGGGLPFSGGRPTGGGPGGV